MKLFLTRWPKIVNDILEMQGDDKVRFFFEGGGGEGISAEREMHRSNLYINIFLKSLINYYAAL